MATQARARSFAIVTGASTGIGFELAKCCAQNGFHLLFAADQPAIQQAATELRAQGASVDAVQADLATVEGVNELLEVAIAAVLPAGLVAEQHRSVAAPGTAKS